MGAYDFPNIIQSGALMMIYCRGNKLRAPTLHLCGEYLAPTDKSGV